MPSRAREALASHTAPFHSMVPTGPCSSPSGARRRTAIASHRAWPAATSLEEKDYWASGGVCGKPVGRCKGAHACAAAAAGVDLSFPGGGRTVCLCLQRPVAAELTHRPCIPQTHMTSCNAVCVMGHAELVLALSGIDQEIAGSNPAVGAVCAYRRYSTTLCCLLPPMLQVVCSTGRCRLSLAG